MDNSTRTRLAILGTLADLHAQPLPYDLACLRQVLIERSPDLLCAEVTPEVWEAGNLSTAELEIREALAPVEATTDIVLVPVAPSEKKFDEFVPARGWRRKVARTLRRLLRWGERLAGTPDAINGFWFGAFCHTVCALSEATWNQPERVTWDRQNREMVENIMRAVHRDPGRRVLVVVQCPRLHLLTPLLRRYQDELDIVSYREI